MSDKINRAVHNMIESVKDTVVANLVSAHRAKQIKFENDQLERLLTVVKSSIDEAYHKTNRSFQASVKQAFDEVVTPNTPAKKK